MSQAETERSTLSTTRGVEISYLLMTPDPAVFPTSAPRPLVVFLHGSGERGDNLDLVLKLGPPRQATTGTGLPFVVLAPQCPRGQWWDADAVIELVREIANRDDVDARKIHLTGISMGGYGTWSILAKQADLFASATPICGGGEPSTAATFKDTPIWAFHGEADKVVPVDETRQMIEALREAGSTDVRATYYPKTGHDSWTAAYSEPALYPWMMLQSR